MAKASSRLAGSFPGSPITVDFNFVLAGDKIRAGDRLMRGGEVCPTDRLDMKKGIFVHTIC